MNISRKTKLRIIVGIAALLIIYGLLESVFHFNIDPKVVNNVGMVLMIAAFGLLFSKEKNNNQTAGEENQAGAENSNLTDGHSAEIYDASDNNAADNGFEAASDNSSHDGGNDTGSSDSEDKRSNE